MTADTTGTKKRPDVRFNPVAWGVYEVVQRADGKVLGRAIRETETNWTAVLYTGTQSLGHRSRSAAADFLWTNTGELEETP